MAGDERGIALELHSRFRLQRAHRGKRHRQEPRLRVLGEGERLGGALPQDFRELFAERGIDLGEDGPGRRKCIGERLAHADRLAALAGKDECNRHWIPEVGP